MIQSGANKLISTWAFVDLVLSKYPGWAKGIDNKCPAQIHKLSTTAVDREILTEWDKTCQSIFHHETLRPRPINVFPRDGEVWKQIITFATIEDCIKFLELHDNSWVRTN